MSEKPKRYYTVIHSDGIRAEDLTADEAVEEINRRHVAGLTVAELDLIGRYGGTMRSSDGAWSVRRVR